MDTEVSVITKLTCLPYLPKKLSRNLIFYQWLDPKTAILRLLFIIYVHQRNPELGKIPYYLPKLWLMDPTVDTPSMVTKLAALVSLSILCTRAWVLVITILQCILFC